MWQEHVRAMNATLGADWQDYTISFGQWMFLFALIPTLLSPDAKPPIATSVMTGLVLSVFAYVFATLGLAGAALSSGLVALAWGILAYQKWHTTPKHRDRP